MIATKMAKLFYQVKEENFSAKISNWEHSRYCEKIQTILFSMLHSQHWYRKFDLFYLWDICDYNNDVLAKRLKMQKLEQKFVKY